MRWTGEVLISACSARQPEGRKDAGAACKDSHRSDEWCDAWLGNAHQECIFFRDVAVFQTPPHFKGNDWCKAFGLEVTQQQQQQQQPSSELCLLFYKGWIPRLFDSCNCDKFLVLPSGSHACTVDVYLKPRSCSLSELGATLPALNRAGASQLERCPVLTHIHLPRLLLKLLLPWWREAWARRERGVCEACARPLQRQDVVVFLRAQGSRLRPRPHHRLGKKRFRHVVAHIDVLVSSLNCCDWGFISLIFFIYFK